MPRNRRQKRRRNIGNKARQRLPLLLEIYGHQCYWCKKDLVLLRSIDSNLITNVSHGSITFEVEGKISQKFIASVDHKVGLVDGGTNDIMNLVPSCRYCNEDRGRKRENQASP